MIKPQAGPLITRQFALLITLCCISFATILTWYATQQLIESIVIQLLFIMFFFPASVILISHRPTWLKVISFIILGFSALIQIAFGAQ